MLHVSFKVKYSSTYNYRGLKLFNDYITGSFVWLNIYLITNIALLWPQRKEKRWGYKSNKDLSVQECDATMLNSSKWSGPKKLKNTLKPNLAFGDKFNLTTLCLREVLYVMKPAKTIWHINY